MTSAIAQNHGERPAPGSLPIPSQPIEESVESFNLNLTEDEAEELGFVRVFDFRSDTEAPPIAILLANGDLADDPDNTSLVPLLRGSVPPTIREFLTVKAGTYTLLIRPETVTDFNTQDLEKLIPAYRKGEELIAATTLDIKPGSFQTIVTWGKADKLNAVVHLDPKLNEPRTLDVWSFLDDQEFSIEGRINGDMRKLTTSDAIGLTQTPLQVATINPFEMVYEKKTGSIVRLPVEVEARRNQSISLVAFRDRYGRVKFRGFEGASEISVTPSE